MHTHPKRFLKSLFAICAMALMAVALAPGGALRGAAQGAGGEVAGVAPAGTPVWGRKPVLAYFLLTPSLAAELQQELGLPTSQLARLQQIAREETVRLQALEQEAAVQSAQVEAKEVGMEAETFNSRVASIVQEGGREVAAVLEAQDYDRLVDWINTRWEIERERHGIASATQRRRYEIYATRFDAGGSYTVALPDKCLKITNNGSSLCEDSGYQVGQEYAVRIEYQSSVRVGVGESGPWNVDDNFWSGVGDPQPRRMFIDLPRGMPEAQAAYFDDYNGGKDQFGRTVTSPVAIDLAREVSVDIGLQPGTNDWVTVTLLWTDGWSDTEATVVSVDEPSRLRPPYSGDMCGSAWHRIEGYAGSHAYLTLNVATAGEVSNRAEWSAVLPKSGRYRVQAYIPDHPPIEWQCPSQTIPRDTAQARYTIFHAGGESTVRGNQGPLADLWLDLGEYEFVAGQEARVELEDHTGEESFSRTVAFSAIRFVSQETAEPTPEPSPTPLPTATPTPKPPDPLLWINSLPAEPGAEALISIRAGHLPAPGLGEVSLELRYPPGMLTPLSCQADPVGLFASASCQLDFERDGTDPDSLRLQLSSPSGVSGEALLAQVVFQVAGDPGQSARLQLAPQSITAPGGAALTLEQSNGVVCVQPCGQIRFLPWLLRLFGIGG